MDTAASMTKIIAFKYEKPDLDKIPRRRQTVWLGTTDRLFATIQAHREGGEVKLHSHTHLDGLWFVLAGRVRFYSDETTVCADMGAGQGVIVPRGEQYWFEAYGPEDLEIFQVECSDMAMTKDAARKERGELVTRSGTAIADFRYAAPTLAGKKAIVWLTRTDRLFATIQVIAKDGGETNLHSHEYLDGVWYVLAGRARFYSSETDLVADIGPQEGVLIPRGEKYWFESSGDAPLQILQVLCADKPILTKAELVADRTDYTPQGPREPTVHLGASEF
jgi:mannose-6-phosphate isomerase-like protein (cupin superfamily)